MDSPTPPKTLYRYIVGYASGEGALSLTFNGIYAFAMLYYTQALGLSFAQAGIAFSIAAFWDALVDPAMGFISDHTRTRWGRRQPYIVGGGLVMAASFYYLWAVPGCFRGELLFPYLVAINLVYRTAYAVFSIPYTALGFEICSDYQQRSQVQSARAAFNMLANILGPALAWTIFFPDRPGRGPEATSIASNYLPMGTTFSIATAGFVLLVVAATHRYVRDSRGVAKAAGNRLGAFYRDIREIVTDRYLRPVMIFFCTGLVGALFVATTQMYLYVYFMHLTSHQKSFIHGGGMVLYGAGALTGLTLVRLLDKKFAVCVGAAITACADLTAGIVFVGGFLTPTSVWIVGGHAVPIALIVFGACDMINWFGVGLYAPIATSMLADVSEVDELRSGVRKDGGYAAVFTFSTKLVYSAAGFFASACLAWVGFAAGSDHQTPQAIHWLVLLTFGFGALFALLVIPTVLRYPIDRAFMTRVKAALAERKSIIAETPGLTL